MKITRLIWVGAIPTIACLVLATRSAGPSRVTWVPLAKASDARLSDGGRAIRCDDKKPQKVRVTVGRITVINFPFKPKDVVPGEVSFDFKKIKNDLVIKAIKSHATTNLVVYLEDRRCTFELLTVARGGDDILIVRDSKDDQMEPTFHD
jgi:hypothetical protein